MLVLLVLFAEQWTFETLNKLSTWLDNSMSQGGKCVLFCDLCELIVYTVLHGYSLLN